MENLNTHMKILLVCSKTKKNKIVIPKLQYKLVFLKDFFLATSMSNLTLVYGYLFSWEDGREEEDQVWKILWSNSMLQV